METGEAESRTHYLYDGGSAHRALNLKPVQVPILREAILIHHLEPQAPFPVCLEKLKSYS